MIMRRSAFALALTMGACFASSAHAEQATPTSPPPVAEQEVVVTGQRTEEAVRAFVGQIAVAVRGADQLARWDGKICPGMSGMKAAYARPVLDRLATHAYRVGLDVGEPGCKPNILILVTPRPDEAAKDAVENNRDVLGWHAQRGQLTQGRDGLREFMDSDAPVRWWHVSRITNSDGSSVGDSSTGDAQNVRVYTAGRVRKPTRQEFGGVFIIVDANRIGGLPLGSLADYLSMVALAQLDPGTDTTPYPTILNIFNGVVGGQPDVAAMSTWDLTYLRGLYGTHADLDADSQRSDIANQMNRALSTQ
jgi:hypothetical protein